MEISNIDLKYFHVFKQGKLTVVGLEGQKLINCLSVRECRDSLLSLADHPEYELLAVDLIDVGIIGSWLLGVLAAVQQRGVEVHLYHPSPEIRGVLDDTRLEELMKIRDSL